MRKLALLILVPGVVLILAALLYIGYQRAIQAQAQHWAAARFGLENPVTNRLLDPYVDKDQDLVADPPAAAEYVVPETLVFSYIPGPGDENSAEVWLPLMDALSAATGLPVEYLRLGTIEAQLAALKNGQLHVTGLNTGSVPCAVNACGFVPVATIGDKDGRFGITTKFIVAADSPLQDLDDLRGRRITFTAPGSNSGFKAPVVLLQDFGLVMHTDYDYGFSTSHDESIRRIKSNDVAVAPVASDMLDRAVARGMIAPDEFRVIYTSEVFPPAALGYLYRLAPPLAEKVRRAILDFQPSGELETILGGSGVRFVEVSYKNAWALIRRIDDVMGVDHVALIKDASSSDQTVARSTEP
jgi:phosphonate transport system substrate-binding protein